MNVTKLVFKLLLALPFLIPGMSQEVQAQRISAGSLHSFAICSDSSVMGWGDNWNGQLGGGSSSANTIPVQVNISSSVTAVSAKGERSLALKGNGTVWAWGGTPTQITALTNIIAVAAGGNQSLALKNDGTVWTWSNSGSQPTQVASLAGIIAIAAGGNHYLALRNDGRVLAWGNNSYGQLGNGNTNNATAPVLISSLTGITSISGGEYHSLALKSNGTVWAWGYNGSGVLGNGNSGVNSSVPVQVSSLSGITAISAGKSHSLALRSNGTVWAWGDGNYGKLGNSSYSMESTPIQVNSLTGAIAVAAGGDHSLALAGNGKVWSWGLNSNGQLGTGGYMNNTVPVSVINLCATIASVPGDLENDLFAFFPNPVAQGQNATLQFKDLRADKAVMRLYDVTGRVVLEQPLSGKGFTHKLLLEGVAAGIYQLKFAFGNKMFTRKLMVQ